MAAIVYQHKSEETILNISFTNDVFLVQMRDGGGNHKTIELGINDMKLLMAFIDSYTNKSDCWAD
jgi:hypothetical protein